MDTTRNYRLDLANLAKWSAEEIIEDTLRNDESPSDIDVWGEAHATADSTDLVIYTHHALALCDAVDGDTLAAAEEQAADCGGIEQAFRNGGLGGVACLIAYHIVSNAVAEALEELIEAHEAQALETEEDAA